MKAMAVLAAVGLGLAFMAPGAEAAGCLKGAAVGGVAGHLAGHGVAGAAVGCAVGHHEANKDAKQKATQVNKTQDSGQSAQ